MPVITIGIVALQGCVTPHIPHIEALGHKAMIVRQEEEFLKSDAFILPGGESTTMWKTIDNFNLQPFMEEEFKKKCVWGICAGAILMARSVLGKNQRSFALADFDVERNAYGRQVDSHEKRVNGYDVSFIRAPKIRNVDRDKIHVFFSNDEKEDDVAWLATKNGRYMVSTFHPELNQSYPSPMHKKFIEMVLSKK